MPTDRPYLSATTPVLTCLPALSYFLLRPPLLTRFSAFPRASWVTPRTALQGILDRRHRAGFRLWPSSAVLPISGTHNILLQTIRIGAITLQYCPISRPYGRLS
jgi:hypothetical protein